MLAARKIGLRRSVPKRSMSLGERGAMEIKKRIRQASSARRCPLFSTIFLDMVKPCETVANTQNPQPHTLNRSALDEMINLGSGLSSFSSPEPRAASCTRAKASEKGLQNSTCAFLKSTFLALSWLPGEEICNRTQSTSFLGFVMAPGLGYLL